MIYPCFWFDKNANEAAEFYCAVFNNSEITSETPIVVTFETSGQKFMCLNGGYQIKFNPLISFFVLCETIEETDKIWEAFADGGIVLMPLDKYEWSDRYGWVQDKFGISWQLSNGKVPEEGQKFNPVLMFSGKQNGKAEQAIQFYTSIFDNSAVVAVLRYAEAEMEVEGNIKHSQFRLGRQVFIAMDSSLPHKFSFNEAVSFVVECETQEEIDFFWNRFTEKGKAGNHGWLKDRFGISWQIFPKILEKLMSDQAKSDRVISAFMQMKKFEIDKLVNA